MAAGTIHGLPQSAGGTIADPPSNTTLWPDGAGRCAVVWNLAWADMDGRDADSSPDAVGLDDAVVRIRASRRFVTFRGEPVPVTFLLRDVICRMRDGHLVAPDGKPYIVIVPSSGGGVQETGWHYTATVEQGGTILHSVVFDAPAGSTVDLTLLTGVELPRLVSDSDVAGLWAGLKAVYSTEDGARQVAAIPEQVDFLLNQAQYGTREFSCREFALLCIRDAVDEYQSGAGGCDYWRIVLSDDANLVKVLDLCSTNPSELSQQLYYGYVEQIMREHPDKLHYLLEHGGYSMFVEAHGWVAAPDLWKTYADTILSDEYGMERSIDQYRRVDVPTESDYFCDWLWDKPYLVARALFDPTIQGLIRAYIADESHNLVGSVMNLYENDASGTGNGVLSRLRRSMDRFRFEQFWGTGSTQEDLNTFCARLDKDTIGTVSIAPVDAQKPVYVTCVVKAKQRYRDVTVRRDITDLCYQPVIRQLLVLPGMTFEVDDPSLAFANMSFVRLPNNVSVDM